MTKQLDSLSQPTPSLVKRGVHGVVTKVEVPKKPGLYSNQRAGYIDIEAKTDYLQKVIDYRVTPLVP